MQQINMFGDEKEKSTDWKWSFKDYPEKNGLKVFSCFACGGGSTMGYKLAGCDVIGDLEIDPRMNKVYVENHHPKYNYLEDIRDFNKREDLPEELYNLDILDGSPPCSTFSMAGQREDAWGKKKKFREGQKEQTLDDLLKVAQTIHNHGFYRGNDKTKFTVDDYRNCSTFAQDYNFGNEVASYICGMSVPPLMIKRLMTRLIDSGLFDYKLKGENNNESSR